MSAMAFTESLACGLQKSIGSFCAGDDFSDFTVVVEGTHFRCHKVILSASTGFFLGLLRSRMKECQEGFVKLDRITKNTFEIVLNSIYKGIDGLNKDTVLDVWSATELLQIDYMIEECKKFVINNISVDSCLAYLNHAIIYSAQNVIDHSMNFIIKNFKQVRNQETFLQLPFDYLYKIIESDCLETDSEDAVLETILAWVNYEPSSQPYKPGKDPTNCDKPDTTPVYNKERGRKNYFEKLLSACRYLLVNSACLQKVMKKHVELLLKTGTYNLVLKALVYTLSVDQHHDSWPDAAVHRSSSSSKHVMVFLSDDKVMAYSLSTGHTHTFMKVPNDFLKELHKANIIVSGNILYLHYEAKDTDKETETVRKLSMITKQKNWLSINRTITRNSKMLVAHGSCLYELYTHANDDRNCLRRYICAYGNTRDWSTCFTSQIIGDCLTGFQEYIVVFRTEDNVVKACCYNTETEKIHASTTSMDGTSKSMVSFRHGKDIYLLQTNGSLWKLFSTDTSPVDFELVSKLWDFDCSPKGCVLYRKKLFIFCGEIPQMDSSSPLTSVPEIFDNIQMIKINSRTTCLPMIMPQSWLS
ncbi:unnamed protein product [Candidula unifasciata]|uniref:BTB domain-containing protein n=1 Tax=Candidula unifasciata TaxID=100452 RepID=A0A8S3ZDT3_9EUPU|nr:unnamed protein product [Candidula unifasciata]